MINFWTMKTLECLIYQGMISELVYVVGRFNDNTRFILKLFPLNSQNYDVYNFHSL